MEGKFLKSPKSRVEKEGKSRKFIRETRPIQERSRTINFCVILFCSVP